MAELTGKQRRHLRSLAARLKATVQVGREGLSERLLQSLEAEFGHRELVKVSVNPNAEVPARELARDLAQAAGAHWVQTLGRTVVLYRAAEPPEIALPAP
jgi:RNA-binding protein